MSSSPELYNFTTLQHDYSPELYNTTIDNIKDTPGAIDKSNICVTSVIWSARKLVTSMYNYMRVPITSPHIANPSNKENEQVEYLQVVVVQNKIFPCVYLL